MEIPDYRPILYRLDAENRIVDVGGDWDRFAIDNDAEEISGHTVVGVPLRRFVSGDITRMFLDTMLMRVRVSNAPVSASYRCDSPGLKRQMAMTLNPDGQDIVVTHRVVAVEHLPRPLQVVKASDSGRRRLVKRCSMCARLSLPGGAAIAAEDYQSATANSLLAVIYDICTNCQGRWRST